MTLVLKQYEQSVRETLANLKLAIRRRDAKGALAQAANIPLAHMDELWSSLREWSVSETRMPDSETFIAVRALYDNYQLEPKKAFLERAVTVVAYSARS